ncbi:MAG: hypothetical protein M1832_001057 [Thelocarpon impressellum]|nr:MAG: hypothetical protein M1832_001057 [Thelocarpon impressellum]
MSAAGNPVEPDMDNLRTVIKIPEKTSRKKRVVKTACSGVDRVVAAKEKKALATKTGKAQSQMKKGRVTKPLPVGEVKPDTGKRKRATEKSEEVSNHFQGAKDSNVPLDTTPGGLLLEEAIRRRRDWTPLKDTTRPFKGSSVADEGTAEKAGGGDGLGGFGNLLESFGYADQIKSSVVPKTPRADGSASRKKRIVEVVKTPTTSIGEPPTTAKVKAKAPKKRPRTLTEKATANYVTDQSPMAPPPVPALDCFLPCEAGEDAARTNPGPDAADGTAKAKPVRKPRARKEGTKPRPAKRKSKTKDVPPPPSLLSPESAMKHVHKQDFIFGTSSQLAREESPTVIRELQQAIEASVSTSPLNVVDNASSASTTGRGTAVFAANRGLWAAAARDVDGSLLEIEVVDLANSKDDDCSDLPNIPDDDRSNQRASAATKVILDSAITNLAIPEDDDRSQRASAATNVKLANGDGGAAVKKPRGRPRKKVIAAPPVQLPRTPPRTKRSDTIIEEISDSDSPPTPSPPRRSPKSPRTAPRPLQLSTPPRTNPTPGPTSATEDAAAQEARLLKSITLAIRAQPRSSSRADLSFHEKILLYEPLVLEDLAAWLNTVGLPSVGNSEEVDPKLCRTWNWPSGEGLSADELEQLLLSIPQEEKAREWSRYYTSGPHLAGKNLSQAIWTKQRWQEFGVSDSSIVTYDVYVNYPAGHRLALLEKAEKDEKDEEGVAGRGKTEWKVRYEASLEEDVLKEDGTSGLKDRIPTFHGYSASGNVTGPYVFVNYGTYKDYEDLIAANVSLKGKIALAKYGGVFRGLKVRRAQELGMIGTVIYSDPGDDGENTIENGHKPYPEGPARQPSSVQRGSAEFLSVAPGDPTTPGYPSKPGVPRQDTSDIIPSIPSLPISYEDAIPLLKALNGQGPNSSAFNEYWQRGGLGYRGVEYSIGPSPDDLALNLVNEQDYVTTPMWNVVGIINGSLLDEVVILGNHRDAWIAGGAGDPNSGSAALNEVVRSFGEALKHGWKPLRTVVFCSWDGEEYGLIGSTEWVEEYLPWLSKSAVAYLNVDVGTAGPNFGSAAAPLLNQAVYEASSRVQSPNQTIPGQTVRDTWNGKIRTIGSGSDFTAFQDFAGIPCVDMGFTPGRNDAIYHYHSNYDSFDWMDKFGDPGWHYHVAMAKLWSLLAASIIEKPVIAFSAADYAEALRNYLEAAVSSVDGYPVPINHLSTAISKLHKAATKFDAYAVDLSARLEADVPWWKWWKKVRLYYEARKVNSAYKVLERQFLYEEGLDGRHWFKHTVFAPGLWTGYSGVTFPGLVEALEQGNRSSVGRWSTILESRVRAATELLE